MSENDDRGTEPGPAQNHEIKESLVVDVIASAGGLAAVSGLGLQAASYASQRRTENYAARADRRDELRFRREARERMPRDDQ